MARLDLFEMERYQSLWWHLVEHDLSESGVTPLTPRELLELAGDTDPTELLDTALVYPLSEGSELTRERIASFHPGATAANVTLVNGGSEANHLALWTLLEPGDRLAFMVPNYMQGRGLGRQLAGAVDAFRLEPANGRYALDLDALAAAVTDRTKVVMVCNPDNPTGSVLAPEEMDAVVEAAERVGAWILADEIYRGAEVASDETTPTFWGRSERVVVTGGLSKAFAMPGLRVGWAVAPPELIREIWVRHDYTTLTPGMLSDRLAGVAMEPATRERVLARTRRIVRANLPPLEAWLRSHGDLFEYIPPVAGAIAFARTPGLASTVDLVERIRTEASVLLVPGEMFGYDPGIRFGFGYDVERTLKGLERVDDVLASL
jgi:hypothetical protein